MFSWSRPDIPHLPGEPIALSLYDTADRVVKPVEVHQGKAGIYVCGITPYDSTHLGHAATYLTFDLIHRVLIDQGAQVHYVQNITDVDDPLFERAQRDGLDWQALGTSQIDLFRSDMTNLRVIPPQDYIGAMESVDEVITLVSRLLETGAAYIVDDPDYPDIYASVTATKNFGYESNYSRALMEELFAERGGDPQREFKKDPLDALIWRAHREGEPSWDSPFGPGRPGWHIECAAIAAHRLGNHFAIQGGGSDLIFPHHEFSAAHVEAACDSPRMAGHYVHTGMISLDGVKMSKSLGNLVFVSHLTRAGHDPAAIRLSVFSASYRASRDFSQDLLAAAEDRLALWRSAISRESNRAHAEDLIQFVRTRLADDLDTPGALSAIDRWAHSVVGQPPSRQTLSEAGQLVQVGVDALLGIKL
ncbi:cysteine--1-D-myo-inosityl 2-amino-2-deoxy-alpha-D-glucopyranoside ligase [Corynebacterium sp. ES2715-CONJ3]|uniref:cysteine--1-D-myo-inosityl 2-amino-2-deoxy-alpha-D-glucopyranoside ligase n=1 Tax=Corynebacterium sp. ES2715-CONJ3 TaxID=2974028 RepID=UPI002169225B|nr:cysteine--1-D-myo-inosityl 2-amino-2-deoxy-alpha-D-glucopyranoside ligase [Corynebacterium sp. ES2715-CONJ3]MCS4491144.1 cysteine--1-D-myo-inosityl 2-amino-2-deoxy-alpha-D-glucopyranoside ligase [Corynebacterium sp. ES2715-CONJ3]